MLQTWNRPATPTAVYPRIVYFAGKSERLNVHIQRLPGRALFNQEKSKLMQTKGQLLEKPRLLFRLHHLRFFP